MRFRKDVIPLFLSAFMICVVLLNLAGYALPIFGMWLATPWHMLLLAALGGAGFTYLVNRGSAR